MIRPSLRALAPAILFALFTCYLWFQAAENYWGFTRMRPLPVEVLQSSLHIHHDDGYSFLLKLDLRATASADRQLHVEEYLDDPSTPEEAAGVLQLWSPGSRHTIHVLRGDAREIRLPYTHLTPETHAAIGYLIGSVFPLLFTIIAAGYASSGPAESQGSFLFGASIFCGILCAVFLLGAAIYSWYTLPPAFAWPIVTATHVNGPVPLPPSVHFTPAARRVADENPSRLYAFPFDGRTIHANRQAHTGPYMQLPDYCGNSDPCTFRVNPADRWSVAEDNVLDSRYYVTMAIILAFAAATFAAARTLLKAAVKCHNAPPA